MKYNKFMATNNHKAFTLPELLVVVALVAIIASALLTTINPFTQYLRGYDTVRRDDLTRLRTAFENYYIDHDCFPSNELLSQCGSNALAPYLDKVPCDPGTKQPYTLLSLPENSSCSQKFAIYSELANKADTRGDFIEYCKDTIAVSSADMAYLDIIKGCSDIEVCQSMYGCRNGTCTLLFEDAIPTCGIVYCNSNCNNKNCAQKNGRGAYINECR
jgi:prepilin-type N-terminal cleavage/methylation domain-containing protein